MSKEAGRSRNTDGLDAISAAILNRNYEGQAHHMSKAAHSLVNMLNGIDYAKFSTPAAVRLTGDIHRLINSLEYARTGRLETYPVRRQDGEVVNVTVPEREV